MIPVVTTSYGDPSSITTVPLSTTESTIERIRHMKLCGYDVSNFSSPFVIAEIGANHNGDMSLARKLVDAAKDSGCHSVKFQSWSASSIFSKVVFEDNHFLADDYRDRKDYTLKNIVDEFSVSSEQLRELKHYCDKVNIDFSCTPFSFPEVDFLVDDLDVAFVKVASMDINNSTFLDYIARKGKPVVLSTGLAAAHEIDQAVETFEAAGNRDLILLHCVAQYPPKIENINLNNLDMLRNTYPDYPVGFSDHTIGTAIPLAAIAKGACMIEKHFTLDKEMFGWDHKVSGTPEEMAEIVSEGRKISQALGSFRRVVSEEDLVSRSAFRRSIVSARSIPKGKIIEREDLEFKRPGTGIPPNELTMVIGRTATQDIDEDQLLTGEDF